MAPKAGGEVAESSRRMPPKALRRPVLLIDTQDVSRFCAERLHKQIINKVSIGARREG
jgi:hypothetical protein